MSEQKRIANELDKRVAELTRELAEANLQLQQSNVELNQFAYIASHDLQEPLRKVRTFTNMMVNTMDTVSPRTQEFLKKIEDSTERMQTLINDVLRFSLLSKEREKFTLVDLNHVVENVLHDYELAIEQKKAVVTVGQLPSLEAIPLQMSQLFTNLLSNALKFSRPSGDVQISINCKTATPEVIRQYGELNEEVPHYQVEVADNGIGFEPAYAQQIFTIFQRLHGRSEYEGSGIGLAICFFAQVIDKWKKRNLAIERKTVFIWPSRC